MTPDALAAIRERAERAYDGVFLLPEERELIRTDVPALLDALARAEREREQIVAGALFDFLGYLTTRPEPLTMGSAIEAPPALEALQAWAAGRGLSLDGANVHGWQAALAGREEEA